MKFISKTIALLFAGTTTLTAPAAHAQKWLMTGTSEASSGVESGGGRSPSVGRAQTRMRMGVDLAVDESPEDVFGAAVLVALEPRTAFGLDARYTRVLRERFAFSAGAIGFIQPGTLVGPVGAFEYRHPIANSFRLTAGPELDVFVVGNDLPDKTVIWQALFHVGLRVDL